jgi:hypothetical protein
MTENIQLEQAQAEVEQIHCDFYIRRMKPEEASVISRLAYYAYSLTYIYDQIYYPERVRQLNASGDLRSFVAANKANEEVVGHCAVIKDDFSEMVELGVAFTNPVYRGSGCLKELTAYQFSVLMEEKCCGVFAHAVTTHPYSQKAAKTMGMHEAALLISRLSVLSLNKINTEALGRESLLLQCRMLQTVKIPVIYAPSHHAEMIRAIFDNIELGVDAYVSEVKIDSNKLQEQSVFESKTDSYQAVQIFLKEYGADALSELRCMLKGFCRNRFETIYLFLPLDSPETLTFCKQAEDMGFFFSGVRPGFNGRFWLLLQYLNNQQYDYSRLKFCSDFGNRLMEYIRKQDPTSEN